MDEIHSSNEKNEMLLQELVVRFATPPEIVQIPDLRLLVGKIPEDLFFDVPLPEGSVILGSLLQDATQGQIALDTPLSCEQTIKFYRKHLLTAGWDEHATQHSRFVPADGDSLPVSFSQYGSYVQIRVQPKKEALTAVRITYDRGNLRDNPTVMALLKLTPVNPNLALELIPRLEAPAGVQVRDGVHGNILRGAQASAVLVTERVLSVLSDYYATQLKQAGWIPADAGINGPVAWHTWAFQDKEQEMWSGRFFLLQMPDKPQEYYLYIQVTK